MISALPETTTAPAPLSDEEVVRRVVAGETALFEVLMRRHNQRVYRTIRSVQKDEDEVEDAMQQAWVTAYLHLREFAFQSAFSTWLVRIAMNEALGRLRRGARVVRLAERSEEEESDMQPSDDEGPEERAGRAEAMRLLERAVDGLPDIYRSTFVLREIEQLSTDEAAAALGVAEDVIKVRLHRARGLLREALAAEVDRAAPDAFSFLAPRCNRIVAAVLTEIARLGPPPAPAGD
jgi:RNA polymerase sigma-70 factor (ECF subfamily)